MLKERRIRQTVEEALRILLAGATAHRMDAAVLEEELHTLAGDIVLEEALRGLDAASL